MNSKLIVRRYFQLINLVLTFYLSIFAKIVNFNRLKIQLSILSTFNKFVSFKTKIYNNKIPYFLKLL